MSAQAIRQQAPFHVVLDIDGVLCAPDEVNSVSESVFFQDKGTILEAQLPHYIFPGVIEFLRALLKTDEVRISFFSAGKAERNMALIKGLLEKCSLPEKARKKEIYVFSREHMSEISPGKIAKSLSVFSEKIDEIKNTILIDDNPGIIHPDEIENLLFARTTKARHFSNLPKIPDKIFSGSANQIYYLAGMLFKSIEEAKEQNVSLSEVLFRAQRKIDGDQLIFNKEIFSNMSIYELGLKKLREENPDLQFTTKESYLKVIQRDVPDQERFYLEGLLRFSIQFASGMDC